MERLGNVQGLVLHEAGARPERRPQCAVAVGDGFEVLIPLAGAVDMAAETARVDKEIARLAAEPDGVAKRLANPSFVERAPREVVEEARARVEELGEKRRKLEAHRALLAGGPGSVPPPAAGGGSRGRARPRRGAAPRARPRGGPLPRRRHQRGHHPGRRRRGGDLPRQGGPGARRHGRREPGVRAARRGGAGSIGRTAPGWRRARCSARRRARPGAARRRADRPQLPAAPLRGRHRDAPRRRRPLGGRRRDPPARHPEDHAGVAAAREGGRPRRAAG